MTPTMCQGLATAEDTPPPQPRWAHQLADTIGLCQLMAVGTHSSFRPALPPESLN
jgi:hypothetical protein